MFVLGRAAEVKRGFAIMWKLPACALFELQAGR